MEDKQAKRPFKPDWNPTSEEVQLDQRKKYDEMRENCPVAYSHLLGWSVFRHEEVMKILLDPHTFSNRVSQHISVPNSMDPPVHKPYRDAIESYFLPERMAEFEPSCRRIAGELVQQFPQNGEVEWISNFSSPFAVQAQCAFLGWLPDAQNKLVLWIKKNQEATFKGNRRDKIEVAQEFEQFISGLLAARRDKRIPGNDITSSLMLEKIQGRQMNLQEITSVFRNWTVGEIGTLSASIGIIAQFLADHQDIQNQLREEPEKIPEAIDEILRIYGPLVHARRKTTREAEVGGRIIPAGERISVNWISANRDPRIFEDAYHFHWGRDPDKNLLYGAGIHVCPGAPLARMELRIVVEELFRQTTHIKSVIDKIPPHAVFPASGYKNLYLYITRKTS